MTLNIEAYRQQKATAERIAAGKLAAEAYDLCKSIAADLSDENQREFWNYLFLKIYTEKR